MEEPVSIDTMTTEIQPGPSPSPSLGSPSQPDQSTGPRLTKPGEDAKVPRHGPRLAQRRPPHKKKPMQDPDQSWRWTGSPIVVPGPLPSLWNNRQRPEEREKLSKTNVYLRGLPANITDNDLITMCSPYGRVISAKALVDKTFNRGYGFVDFEQSSSADVAVRDLRSQGFFARMAKAVPRSSEGRGDDPTNLYLANLPPDFNENHVETLLNQYGRITSARVLRDDSGRSRGVGFARMDSLASCERAIFSLNGACNLIPGRPLLVKFADSKKSSDPSKTRVRPPASPQMVWWPNSVGYQQLAVQTPPEHMQSLQLSAMQPPLQQHVSHIAQSPMAQSPMASPALHPGALGQPPLGGHAVFMNYAGYRYVSVSSVPPLSSPPVMSMGECWSPGEVEGAALVDGLN